MSSIRESRLPAPSSSVIDAAIRDEDAEACFAQFQERLDEIKKARAAVAGEFFRQNATQWDRIRKMYINDLEVERALQALIRESDVRDLLDVGTGTGRILEIFGRSINRGVGIDLSREMLAIARVNLEKQGLNNCHVRYGDMNQLPFGDETFDAITFHLALHYAEDPADAIREAARYLDARGRRRRISGIPLRAWACYAANASGR